MAPPKYLPQMQADGSFVMVDPHEAMVEADVSRLSLSELVQYIEKKKSLNPGIEFWVDGDKKVLMSKVKA